MAKPTKAPTHVSTDVPQNASADAPATSIDLDDPVEVARWCAHFGVDGARLQTVVRLVGKMPAAVQTYLLAKGGPPRELTEPMRAEFAARQADRASRRRSSPE